MPPQGYHTVRSHIRRNPRPGGGKKKLSGWTIAGLVAGVWLWGQVMGFGEAAESRQPAPRPSTSAAAQR